MSLLWTKVARHPAYLDEYPADYGGTLNETHDDHPLNPAFEAAGIKHAPCAYSLCDDHDPDHSDTFDRAEEVAFRHRRSGTMPPVERVDLSKPVHGFEPTADMHTLRRYMADPTSRGSHPVWFRHDGKHYIFNGHHGTAAAMHRGDSHLDVHMIDLDKE